ncbi:protein NrfD [Kosakonia sacchari]|nr:protein NrfD [Kosakonia sacchari]
MTTHPFQFDTLVWDWPIALYLFVLGIASGLVLVALGLQRVLPPAQRRWFAWRAAIGAPLMVAVGLTVLVFHLTHPLSFWYVMVFYNPHSVMSLGVMLFQLFFLALALWWLRLGYMWLNARAQQYPQGAVGALLRLLVRVGRWLSQHYRGHNVILGLLAVLLGVYTGFLLSTLKGYPLLNNGVLPLLFLNSGLVSALAVLSLFPSLSRSAPEAIAVLHRWEIGCVLLEVLLLTAFFFSLYVGGGAQTAAALTALSGFWGAVFWIGVVGLGIALPLLMTLRPAHSRSAGVALACVALLSVLLFRFFILYAGQMVIA